jgi:SRSO17 transposase
MGKKLKRIQGVEVKTRSWKRRQGVEGKTRSWKRRQGVEGKISSWKRRQGVEVKRRRSREESPSQEDESVRPHHLEFYPSNFSNQA